MTVTPDMIERLADHTATEADLRAIILAERERAEPDPAIMALVPLHWQLERMDWVDGVEGREPTLADAMALLDSLEEEC